MLWQGPSFQERSASLCCDQNRTGKMGFVPCWKTTVSERDGQHAQISQKDLRDAPWYPRSPTDLSRGLAFRQVREIQMQEVFDKTRFCLWIVEEKEVWLYEASSWSKENSSCRQLHTLLSSESGSRHVWPKRKFFPVWNTLGNPVYTIINRQHVDSSSMKEIW